MYSFARMSGSSPRLPSRICFRSSFASSVDLRNCRPSLSKTSGEDRDGDEDCLRLRTPPEAFVFPVPALLFSAFFFPTPPSRAESRAPPGGSTLRSLSRLLRAPSSLLLKASELSRPPRSRNPSAAGRFSGARDRCALSRGHPAAGAEVLTLPQMSGTHARAVRMMGTLIEAKLRFLAAGPGQASMTRSKIVARNFLCKVNTT